MNVDMSIDHLAWDNTEPVTIELAARVAPVLVAVAGAKRRAVTVAQKSPSGGVYLGFETRWHVPRRELPEGVTLAPADVVIDGGGTRWTVLTAPRNRHGETFALGCVDLVLAHRLRDTVAVERADVVYGPSGAPEKLFPPGGGKDLYVVAARVQELTREAAEERGVRYGKGRYEVTVDRQLRDLDVAEDRLRWADRGKTRYLDVTGYRQPERIDELPVIEAELRA